MAWRIQRRETAMLKFSRFGKPRCVTGRGFDVRQGSKHTRSRSVESGSGRGLTSVIGQERAELQTLLAAGLGCGRVFGCGNAIGLGRARLGLVGVEAAPWDWSW